MQSFGSTGHANNTIGQSLFPWANKNSQKNLLSIVLKLDIDQWKNMLF